MRGVAVGLAALVFSSCGPWGFRGESLPVDAGCERVADELRGTFAEGIESSGRATIDVNQYRVRGQYRLTIHANGNVTLEFFGTTALGGHREDIVLSLHDGTVHLLDRERGGYYHGTAVDSVAEAGAEMRVDVAAVMSLLAGTPPECARMSDVNAGPDEIRGRLDARSFRLVSRGGRLVEARWPAPVSRERMSLVVEYEWEDGGLSRLTVSVPEMRWRVRLSA